MTKPSADGIGMAAQNTLEHQVLQRTILFNLWKSHHTFENRLATETNILSNDSKIKRAPDISFWKSLRMDKRKDKVIGKDPLMTIEITHSYKSFTYSERSIMEAFSLVESIRESFIYDYKTKEWTRYRRMPDGEIKKYEKSSYSEVIKEDLAQFL